jgi:hypothetical protein
MLTQPTDIAETGLRSLNPIGERRETRALIAALEIWLLALLDPLLGARAARAWVASLLPATYQEEPCEFTEEEIRLLIPFLFLIGPGPNRGLRPHARTMPVVLPAQARDPPRA